MNIFLGIKLKAKESRKPAQNPQKSKIRQRHSKKEETKYKKEADQIQATLAEYNWSFRI